MDVQWLYMILFIIGFAALIALVEWIHRRLKIHAEYTRKMAHVLSCLSSLLFLYVFSSPVFVGIIAFVFTIVLYLGKRRMLLTGLEEIGRNSKGSYLLPPAVFISFSIAFYLDNPLLFILSMLITGISDPLAGLSGKMFPNTRPLSLWGGIKFSKSLTGLLLFFTSAFLIAGIVLYTHQYQDSQLWMRSLAVALLTSVAEILSPGGTDNLSVPLTTIAVLLV